MILASAVPKSVSVLFQNIIKISIRPKSQANFKSYLCSNGNRQGLTKMHPGKVSYPTS